MRSSWRVPRAASALGLTGLLGIAACGILPRDASSAGAAKPAAGRVIAVARHEVHEQCPLLVAHPSAHGVTTLAQWEQMLAKARALPPPYDAARTDFSRHTIVLIALPTTARPSWIALAGPDAVRFDEAEQRVDMTLRIERRVDPPDTMRTTVMSSPCLLAWLPALPGLRDVVARDAAGEVIARLQR